METAESPKGINSELRHRLLDWDYLAHRAQREDVSAELESLNRSALHSRTVSDE